MESQTSFDGSQSQSHFQPQQHEAIASIDNNKTRSYKKPFFGVPIVGFFDQRSRKTNILATFTNESNDRVENSRDENQPLLPRKQTYGVTFSVDGVEDKRSSSKRKPRSGKELWSILRYHVVHESFHIRYQFKDTIRRKQDNIQFTEDVDLPYDFSVFHCFTALAVYLIISVIAYSFVFENWTVIDSMYFAVVTFTTIGYGDLSPSTHGGRLFCSFFALAGVAVLAIGLGVVGSKIIESQVAQITKAEELLTNDVLRLFRPAKTKTAEEKQAAYFKHSEGSSGGSGSFAYLDSFDNPNLDLEDAVHPWHTVVDGCCFFTKMLLQYLPSLSPLFLGAYLIGHYEGWTWDDCIYYCVVTTTTIGFGDFTPDTQALRGFAIIFIPLAVGAMGHFLGTIANFIVEQRSRQFDKQLWRHELTLEDLHSISKDHGDVVTELDFVIFMLKAMKKVDGELIEKIRDHFRRLDLTGNGVLDRDDLELMARKKLRGAQSKLRLGRYKRSLEALGSASFSSEEEHHFCRKVTDV